MCVAVSVLVDLAQGPTIERVGRTLLNLGNRNVSADNEMKFTFHYPNVHLPVTIETITPIRQFNL